MSTNPNNAIGTNGAFGGRTSVNALNDVLGSFNGRGVVSGWALVPDSGMDIVVGGSGTVRDVAIAEDNIGNKTTINNISEQPVSVSIPAAPASNKRIDLVVAYVDNPPQGTSTVTDNYGACGLIVVSGTAAATPVAPSEADIRTAITADGGAGTVAYYVVLGQVLVASGTTDIDSTMITAGSKAYLKSDNIGSATITKDKFASGIDTIVSSTTVGSVFTLDTYKSGKKHLYGIKELASSVAFNDTYWNIYQRTSQESYTIAFGTTIKIKSIFLSRCEWGEVLPYGNYQAGTSISSITVIPVQPLGATGATSIRISVDIWGS